MPDFIDIDLQTSPSDLTDTAIDALTTSMTQAGYFGYTPNDGNFEIILINVLSQMAADVANVAVQVPSAIFRTFGTVLLNLPYNQGVAATIQTVWTLSDTLGHTIPGGTYVTVASLGFYVLNDTVVPGPNTFTGTTNGTMTVTGVSSFSGLAVGQVVSATDIPEGATITGLTPTSNTLTLSVAATASTAGESITAGTDTANVYLVATDTGVAYNGYSAPIAPVDQIDWVQSIAATGVSSGGSEPEDDQDYQNRLAAELALQAPRPITAQDYADFSLTAPESILPAGNTTVGRTTAIDGYNPNTTNFTGTVASGSPTVTSVSSTNGLSVGTAVTGGGIPAGTTLTAVGTSTVTMSANATASATGETIAGVGSYNNPRTVTVFVADVDGNALSTGAMSAVQAWLASYREINFQIYVVPPTYTTIYVTFTIHVLPNYDPVSTVAAVQAAIVSYINPASWGSSTITGGPSWLNITAGFNVVRFNKLLGVIEGVNGVDYVPNGGLQIGTSAGSLGTSDITLYGAAPLPITSVATVTGSSV